MCLPKSTRIHEGSIHRERSKTSSRAVRLVEPNQERTVLYSRLDDAGASSDINGQVVRQKNDSGRTSMRSNEHHPLRPSCDLTDASMPRAAHPLPPAVRASCRNRLLDASPQVEQARLRPHLERVALSQGATLYHAEQQITHVYFPIGALTSLVTGMEDGRTVETGLVGSEGMAGLPVAFGADSAPQTMLVRHAGDALRMRADLFCREVNRVDGFHGLHESLMRYTNFSCACAAQVAACNRLHTVEQRVACWILITRDRLGQDEFHTTHGLIARSLGVRRSGVSVVMERFARAGWLRNGRARIRIADRRRLEAAACECYRVIKTEFDKYLNLCRNSASPRALYAGRAG